jgi:hypothetical protein
MTELPKLQVAACLAFCGVLVLLHSQANFTVFAIGEAGRHAALPHSQPINVGVAQDVSAWATGSFQVRDTSKRANTSSWSTMTFLGVVVVACGASRIVMRSQGQGGRFNQGQGFFPKLKGAKKLAVIRRRKEYGSSRARRLPTRYDIYDKLEEYDETLPWYTVLSEPAEPKPSIRDAPLLERYPWAEPFKTTEKKQEKEADADKALEPLFGNFIYDIPPPMTRTQNYIERRGFPKYNYPPWINKPKYGTRWPDVWNTKTRDGCLDFEKDRRCGDSKKEPEELESADDGFDDMDAVLDALDEE